MKKGIDVSYAQGKIDWQRVKNAGIEFCYIRSSFGKNSHQVDARLAENAEACTQLRIPFGFYHYTYADSPSRAREEAAFFLKTIAPYAPTYPLALDVEDATLSSLSKNSLTDAALAFCDEVKKAGYRVCVYASASWLKNKLDTARLEAAGCDIWVAQWASKVTYDGKYDMWQYTDSGKVDGISGCVDLDYCYTDYETPPAPTKDNTPDSYAADAIEWAIENGILKGDENGDYMLHSPVTRQDMLVFLHRFYEKFCASR